MMMLGFAIMLFGLWVVICLQREDARKAAERREVDREKQFLRDRPQPDWESEFDAAVSGADRRS